MPIHTFAFSPADSVQVAGLTKKVTVTHAIIGSDGGESYSVLFPDGRRDIFGASLLSAANPKQFRVKFKFHIGDYVRDTEFDVGYVVEMAASGEGVLYRVRYRDAVKRVLAGWQLAYVSPGATTTKRQDV